MRRARKSLVLLGPRPSPCFSPFSSAAMDIRLATNVSLSAPVRAGNSTYDLAQAQIFTKALYYVNNQYSTRRGSIQAHAGGRADFLQRDVPEILVDRFPEQDPSRSRCESTASRRHFPSSGWTHPGPCAAPCRTSFVSSSRACNLWPPKMWPPPGRDRDDRHQWHALHIGSALGPARRWTATRTCAPPPRAKFGGWALSSRWTARGAS